MTEYQQHVTEVYNHVIPDQDKDSYGYQDRRRWFMSHEDTISLHQWACATYEGDDWDGLQVLIDNWLEYQEKCVELALL